MNTREQNIENYKLLIKKKKDLTRKNRALQTKIAQYVRKNKIDLEGEMMIIYGHQFKELNATLGGQNACSYF